MSGRGFTLIELLVVLAIIAGLAATAPALLQRAVPRMELAAAARDLAAALRAVQSQAIAMNDDAAFSLDVGTGEYSGPSGRLRTLPQNVAISFKAVGATHAGDGMARIWFFADGGSTGGRVILARGGSAQTVSVHWLTGRIVVE